ncbi:MAG: YjbQ family protein [candidate division Zixibacteria bacterium]|nr:YjbQ family protein [Candidatus Tariuqbacter arcticus]
MTIITEYIHFNTKGFTDIIDITPEVKSLLNKHRLKDGQVTVFVGGSTGGITTIEYESGLLKDLPEALEKIAPTGKTYHHDRTWGDGNGYAHVRSALVGPSLTIPFAGGNLLLGTWQQIVFLDFDNRPRSRDVIAQFIGE